MPLVAFIFAFIGLAGIVGGIYAFRSTRRFALLGPAPERWHMYRMIATVFGVICGIASCPLTYVMGYRFETPEGIGRIVGIPFMVAFFDSRGLDYVSSFMMISIIANAVFWSLFPQLPLLFWGNRWRATKKVNE